MFLFYHSSLLYFNNSLAPFSFSLCFSTLSLSPYLSLFLSLSLSNVSLFLCLSLSLSFRPFSVCLFSHCLSPSFFGAFSIFFIYFFSLSLSLSFSLSVSLSDPVSSLSLSISLFLSFFPSFLYLPIYNISSITLLSFYFFYNPSSHINLF